MKIFSINPGSTSTKIALFEDINEVFTKTLRHSVEELANYSSIFEQYEFRKKIIITSLKEEGYKLEDIDYVVGRGGLLKPIPGGVYKVNETMLADLKTGVLGEHASNLGGILARQIANEIENISDKKVDAFIVDPVVVDELDDIARISGHPEVPRISIFHALNQKAVARRFARENNTKYEDLNLIVVHLGGGITVGAHEKGRVIDVNNGLDGDGPFSPERSGGLPAGQLAKLCFSGKYQLHEVKKMITGKGGFVAYLGTNDARVVEDKHAEGDAKYSEIFKAMAYQVAKEVGQCGAVLKGNVDAILITGGIAYAKEFCQWIEERVSFIAPVKRYPGEDEMLALTEGVFYALNGEQEIKEYK
jgi:butyrate kinase